MDQALARGRGAAKVPAAPQRRTGAQRGPLSRLALLAAIGLSVFELIGHGGGASSARNLAEGRLVSAGQKLRWVSIPGRPIRWSWPVVGEGAVGVEGEGVMASAGLRPVPIASLTKVMTALVVLGDHPLIGDEPGPSIPVSAQDVAEYEMDVANGYSRVAVEAGEELTERQALEALLIPSADNMADILARWDAGSISNFVAKMNAEARLLGLYYTHYADASGLDPSSASTAADQVRLAEIAMANPVIASIVSRPSVLLPVAGRVGNYNPLLAHPGIVGVKSGFTFKAGGCLVVAKKIRLGGEEVEVFAAVLGQPNGLQGAAAAANALLREATGALRLVPLASKGWRVAKVQVAGGSPLWGRVPYDSSAIIGWPGLRIGYRIAPLAGKLGHKVKR